MTKRITKKELQEEVDRLTQITQGHLKEIKDLMSKLDSIKQLSLGGMTSSLVIAAERIAAAAVETARIANEQSKRR
jgi:hypothetical protein